MKITREDEDSNRVEANLEQQQQQARRDHEQTVGDACLTCAESGAAACFAGLCPDDSGTYCWRTSLDSSSSSNSSNQTNYILCDDEN